MAARPFGGPLSADADRARGRSSLAMGLFVPGRTWGLEEAEAEAVRRFGEARPVAAADRARGRVWVARGTFMSAWFSRTASVRTK